MAPPLTPEEIDQKNTTYHKIRTVSLGTFMSIIMSIAYYHCPGPAQSLILTEIGIFVFMFIFLILSEVIYYDTTSKVPGTICMVVMVLLTLTTVGYLPSGPPYGSVTDWILGITMLFMIVTQEYFRPIKLPEEKLKIQAYNPNIKFYLS